jgi:hypothetical protein
MTRLLKGFKLPRSAWPLAAHSGSPASAGFALDGVATAAAATSLHRFINVPSRPDSRKGSAPIFLNHENSWLHALLFWLTAECFFWHAQCRTHADELYPHNTLNIETQHCYVSHTAFLRWVPHPLRERALLSFARSKGWDQCRTHADELYSHNTLNVET